MFRGRTVFIDPADRVGKLFTIIGGGFGLYGYLPAILRKSWGRHVVLPEKCRKTVAERPELAALANNVTWVASVEEALVHADAVAIAVPPFAQPAFIRQALDARIKTLIIEKPVAPTAVEAEALLNDLSGVRYRIGYLFLYASWAVGLSGTLQLQPRQVRLDWRFKADHFAKNKDVWKRYHSKGGGPLRFYGIHVIALLAKLGYTEVLESHLDGGLPDQPTIWNARFGGGDLPPFEVSIDSDASRSLFLIDADWTNTSTAVVQGSSPFADAGESGQDARVQLLEDVLLSFNTPDKRWLEIYRATNALWRTVELAHDLGHDQVASSYAAKDLSTVEPIEAGRS